MAQRYLLPITFPVSRYSYECFGVERIGNAATETPRRGVLLLLLPRRRKLVNGRVHVIFELPRIGSLAGTCVEAAQCPGLIRSGSYHHVCWFLNSEQFFETFHATKFTDRIFSYLQPRGKTVQESER